MIMNFILKLSFTFLVLFSVHTATAQEGWEHIEDRQGQAKSDITSLKEGIYRTFEEFKTNSPSIVEWFELRSEQIFVKDTGSAWIRINDSKIWGCVKNGKIYISKDEGLWRCLNVGSLLHFATVKVQRYYNADPLMYGATVQERLVTKQYCLDTESGIVFILNSKNFEPYANQEPDLKKFKTKNKKKQMANTILLLQAYNELNPLKLNVNE